MKQPVMAVEAPISKGILPRFRRIPATFESSSAEDSPPLSGIDHSLLDVP